MIKEPAVLQALAINTCTPCLQSQSCRKRNDHKFTIWPWWYLRQGNYTTISVATAISLKGWDEAQWARFTGRDPCRTCLWKRETASRGNTDEKQVSELPPTSFSSQGLAKASNWCLRGKKDLHQNGAEQQCCATGGSKFGQIGCWTSIKVLISLLKRVRVFASISSTISKIRSYILPN